MEVILNNHLSAFPFGCTKKISGLTLHFDPSKNRKKAFQLLPDFALFRAKKSEFFRGQTCHFWVKREKKSRGLKIQIRVLNNTKSETICGRGLQAKNRLLCVSYYRTTWSMLLHFRPKPKYSFLRKRAYVVR
ncbi:MAG: hypothetical protein JWR61_398 [Ferruginibacter sp.]|nr:hypothetical protein [Ferruginibacter sp.]